MELVVCIVLLTLPCVYISGSSDLLTAPGQGCPTPGCNGVGHIRGPRYGTHYTLVACTQFCAFSLFVCLFFCCSFSVSCCFSILVSYVKYMIIFQIRLTHFIVNIFYVLLFSYSTYSEFIFCFSKLWLLCT